ncbi:MAG TPA: hypothetical protein VN937_24020 [Blastocatellia bacterium]|nr:hypothetical protein [Blastocatellia bacterium]
MSASALVRASHAGSFVNCSHLSKKLLGGFEAAIGRAHGVFAQFIDVGGLTVRNKDIGNAALLSLLL